MTISGSEKYSRRKLGYENNGGSNPKLQISLRSSILILAVIVSVIVLKLLVVLTGKPAASILLDSGAMALAKIQLLSNWLSENCSHLLWPSIKGSSWILFSWMLLYLDSSEPGVNPPTTLSPRQTNYIRKSSSHHIGYLTSLATGIVIFCLSLSNV
ncbi:hypothetical protein HA402_007258 [Bradysia odoriphaga]|nr:hypothetical protein HA402_007258 [Bradysia odoriphaga]